MYICKNCGEVFDVPKKIFESHGFTDGTGEELFVCPNCEGDYEEAIECENCGAVVGISDVCLTDDDKQVCQSCADELAAEAAAEPKVSVADAIPHTYNVWQAERFHQMSERDQEAVFERATACSALCLDKNVGWCKVKETLEHIVDELSDKSTEDNWYTIPPHDPSRRSHAEVSWDKWVAETVLTTGVCAGQYREMLATMLLRYCWTHYMEKDLTTKMILHQTAYQLCPSVMLPRVASYNALANYVSEDEMKADFMSTCRHCAVHSESNTGVQIEDTLYVMPSDTFNSMLYTPADETSAMFVVDETAIADRKLFVKNLGLLLSQTREGIKGAYLDEREMVHVVRKDGYESCVNVAHDSYTAIIRDVCNHMDD